MAGYAAAFFCRREHANSLCVYCIALRSVPYSGKFLQGKIFADGSTNKNSRITFSRMLVRLMVYMRICENSRILFSRMVTQSQNLRKLCLAKISRYIHGIHEHTQTFVMFNTAPTLSPLFSCFCTRYGRHIH